MQMSTGDPARIIRTERGLTIAGTRTTIYNVLDYLKAEWPPQLIQDWLLLSDAQMHAALAYSAAHRDAVESDYQTVLRQAHVARAFVAYVPRDLLKA